LRTWFVAVVLALACLTHGAAAVAHPLGNFTINHLTILTVHPKRVALRYVVDMAEIPTFQTLRERDARGGIDARTLERWAHDEAPAIARNLALDADGRSPALVLDRAQARTRPGAGGLPTLYGTFAFHVEIDRTTRRLAYRDGAYAGRLGWKDVVVAPASEPTRELTRYPNALLGSPRATLAVDLVRDGSGTFVARPHAGELAAATVGPAASAVRSNRLSDLVARGTKSPALVALTFLVAIGLGALHALEPGHGKTLLAVSLVGARATIGQAAILAGALTVAHTIGVIVLGVALALCKGRFVSEDVYPWITLCSGIVVALVGARAVGRELRRNPALGRVQSTVAAAGHRHDHAHAGHVHLHLRDHAHDELDDEAHALAHAIPGTRKLTFPATVLAAMSGGIAPCPAALVVLLAAISLDETAYGILVIVAFSFGLAATLTGLGIGVVRGAAWLSGRPRFETFVRYGPLVSACIIATIGSVMVGEGMAQRGAHVPPLAVALLTAVAVAAYAFSHPAPRRSGVRAV